MVGERNPSFGKVGPLSPSYKAGHEVTRHGYILLSGQYGHPFASRGRIFEHRVALETYLRLVAPDSEHLVDVDGVMYLRPELEVHHINHDKQDNRPANLLPLSKVEHAKLHARLKRKA